MSLTRRRRHAAAPTSTPLASSPAVPVRPVPLAKPAPSSSRAALLQAAPRQAEPRLREPSVHRKPAGAPAVVVVKKAGGRSTAHWKQPERWFWLTHPESLERELVKPSGTTHTQGPHEMVEYTTQGGSIKTCSMGFFEANTQPWVPGTGMR